MSRYAHSSVKGRSVRWWGTFDRIKAHVELAWFSSSCGWSFGYNDEHGWGGSICIPGIVSVYAFLDGIFPSLKRERTIEVRIHSGAIWWSIWRDWRDGWSRDIPKWRDGNFNVVDFLLGDSKCSRREVEERDVLVPMPEKCYAAKAKLTEYTWKRTRWFAKRMLRVQIDIEEGIPSEGKGENSWDCGTDATYGLTTGECRSIPEGVGQLVGHVLAQRVKYGGWRDWSWSRPATVQP